MCISFVCRFAYFINFCALLNFLVPFTIAEFPSLNLLLDKPLLKVHPQFKCWITERNSYWDFTLCLQGFEPEWGYCEMFLSKASPMPAFHPKFASKLWHPSSTWGWVWHHNQVFINGVSFQVFGIGSFRFSNSTLLLQIPMHPYPSKSEQVFDFWF